VPLSADDAKRASSYVVGAARHGFLAEGQQCVSGDGESRPRPWQPDDRNCHYYDGGHAPADSPPQTAEDDPENVEQERVWTPVSLPRPEWNSADQSTRNASPQRGASSLAFPITYPVPDFGTCLNRGFVDSSLVYASCVVSPPPPFGLRPLCSENTFALLLRKLHCRSMAAWRLARASR
jgi:hypothetical protein